jgi:ATP-dependent helicase HrpA
MRAIAANQVVIVAGETGSGKTTQLPKMCLELGRGSNARIGHTQPRRLAARAVATRIAEELKTDLGSLVGYQVRFTDDVTDATAVKLMTDGILLAELTHDRDLKAYDTLIIDEAHERSLNIDFILGYLKRLLPRRPDLKVVITSATIDVERFAAHFNDAPIIEVSGRTYPVDVHYLDSPDESDRDTQRQIVDVVSDIESGRYGPRGDVLVFLPGERQIRDCAKELRFNDRISVLPLYARLSQAEQNRVFSQSGAGMRVVLATNVAETSLTVPGIRYVIDPGEARVSRYSYRSGLQRLPIESISQASANQRKGRCGRVADGVCIRLYSEQDFLGRPEFTDAEILRTNLASVILRMMELKLGDIRQFPFIDPPDPKMIRDGYRLLNDLAAVDSKQRLTKIGRSMARLPIDPKLARILIDSRARNCLDEVLVIVSGLAVQDPRERPADKRAQADQQHARFNHPRSDFFSWLNLWYYTEEQRQALSQNQFRKLCQREYLSYLKIREWREVHGQLVVACRQMNMRVKTPSSGDDAYDAIHQALLSGFVANIAQQDEGRRFNAGRNRKAHIFPGSSQAKKPPKWLVASELVETSQVFARQCGAIEPEWLLDTNPDLLKRHHYEPAWQMRSGRVMAKERVTLMGLTISDGRRIHFGEVDASGARMIFIRDGLVPGHINRPPTFLKRNLSVIREVTELESRTRRKDLLVDEESLVRFYDERLPPMVMDMVSLDQSLRANDALEPLLALERKHVLVRDPGGEVESQFPKRLIWQGVDYRLHYQFEPGGNRDGVSVVIPRALLNRVPRYRFEWLVPGMLRDKCIALIRGLPKQLRKQLVPAPDVVDQVLESLSPADEPLFLMLSRELKRQRGVQVSQLDWQQVTIEPFYLMNFQVVDDRGKRLAEGRDLAALITEFRTESSVDVVATKNTLERVNVTRWNFGELPEQWQGKSAGANVVAYPALIPEAPGQLSIRLLDYPAEAARQHRLGIAQLIHRSDLKTAKYLKKRLFRDNASMLAFAGAQIDRDVLIDALVVGGLWQLLDGEVLPRDEVTFKVLERRLLGEWVPHVMNLAPQIESAIHSVADTRKVLSKYDSKLFLGARDDIERQIGALFSEETLAETPHNWLSQYGRFCKAIAHRVERLAAQGGKDDKSLGMLQPQCQRLREAEDRYPNLCALSPPASQFRWMLEEFRVSLFAQQLGTKLPVSAKRLDQQWQAVEAWMTENPR